MSSYPNRVLFDANVNLSFLILILYRDVNWHSLVPPFLFVFMVSLRRAALRYVIAGCEHRWYRLRWLFL